MGKHFPTHLLLVLRIAAITFSSDLRKPCWITGKSLCPKFKKCPVLEKIHIYKLYLVWGLCSPHIQRRVASDQDTWWSMEDVFQTIECITRSKEQYGAFLNPNLETMQPVVQVNELSYSKANWHSKCDQSNSGQPHPVWFSNNFRDTNRHQRGLFKKSPGQQHYKHSPRKLTCYYCEWEHLVKDCIKLAKEKSRDKQKDTAVARHYKNKVQDVVQRGNITINEVSFARTPVANYSVEQTEEILGNMQLDNSSWLDRYPCQVTIDEVCQGHVFKYNIMVNGMLVNALYDTGTSMSCMAKWFFDTLST